MLNCKRTQNIDLTMATVTRYLITTLTCVSMYIMDVSSSWNFLMYKDTTNIGAVFVRHNIDGDHKVHKRSTEDDDWLPSFLEFTFDLHGETISLRLRKNVLEDTSAPVFIVHNGKIAQDFSTSRKKKEDYALYQDLENGASVLVKRRSGSAGFDLSGTYIYDGEEFSIQPMRGEFANHVDHRIAKINLNEASLSHDVIDFGSSLLSTSNSIENSSNDTDEYYSSLTDKSLLTSVKEEPLTKDPNLDIDEYFQYLTNESFSSEGYSHDNDQSLEGNVQNSDQTPQDGNEPIVDGDDHHVTNGHNSKEDSNELVGELEDEDNSTENQANERVKRQTAKNYVVEMLIVVDYGVYEVWFNGVTDLEGEAKREEALKRIKQYYSFVINGVDLRYKSVSEHTADFTMDVTWAGIVIFDTPVPDYWANTEKPPTSSRDFVESSAALEAFRAWAESQGTTLPPSDHVMLFTGHNLTYGGSVSNAGLAYLGSACNPDYFYSIVEEYFEFRDVAIAAHELGHSLGARHDMDGNTCLSFNRNIMTSRFKFPSKRKAKNPWLFSSCSVEYFTDFIAGLDKNDTNCLIVNDANPSNENSQPIVMSLPGEIYSGDDFCKIGEGPDSYICRDQHISFYDNICYAGLYCYRPSDKQCVAKLPPNGMSCGNKKWCMDGTCVESEMAPVTSDECPFGDEPGLIGGKTCAQRMLTSRYECYRDAFRGKCCASCRRYRRNLPGCEYGDMFELCKKEQCTNYDEEYARENCCDTCAELFYTIPSTVVTTVATTVVATTVAETTHQSGTGNGRGGGHGQGKKGPSEDKNESRPDEGENENETERKDGGKRDKKNKTDLSARRRNEMDSEDSDESYNRRRPYRRQRPGYRVNDRRGLNTVAYDRLYQIHSLLTAIKRARARDNTRLQRRRFLMYVLDKTGYDVNADPYKEMSRSTNQNRLGDESSDSEDNES